MPDSYGNTILSIFSQYIIDFLQNQCFITKFIPNRNKSRGKVELHLFRHRDMLHSGKSILLISAEIIREGCNRHTF